MFSVLVYMFIAFSCTIYTSNVAQIDSSKKCLKILMIMDCLPGLYRAFIMNQITGLIDRGHDVHCYITKPFSPVSDHSDVEKYNLIKKTYFNELPKNIHSFDIFMCQFGSVANNFLRLKQQYNLQGKLVVCMRGYDITGLVQKDSFIYGTLIKECNLFLPNCFAFQQRLLDLGCPIEKILTQFSAVDCQMFFYKKRLIKKNERIHVVTVSRLCAKKGIDVAIKAIVHLVKKYPEIRYSIIGDGRLFDQLHQLVYELHIENAVSFLGWQTQDEVIRILDASDIFILPCMVASNGDVDATPNVLKEAMAMGIPVISTRVSGIPELIDHGVNGLLVENNTPELFAKHIEYLIENPEHAMKMANIGRQAVEEKYEKEKTNDRLEKILLNIVK